MIIEHAQKNDLAAIVDIHNQAIKSGKSTADTDVFTVDERREWFKHHTANDYPLLVAKEESIVLGYLTISPYRDARQALKHTAEVSYYIHFKHHRKGVASELMKAALEVSTSLQIKTLVAILIACNQGSIRLLEKSGFEEWGRMPNIVELNEGNFDHLYYGLHLK